MSWSAVTVAEGYNVYRRTLTGTFDYTQPLNGTTPVTATTFRDVTATANTTYVYVIRSFITGASAVKIESIDSAASGQISCASTYNAAVTAAVPTDYFRLGDTAAVLVPTVALNETSARDAGVYGGGVSFGVAGAIACDTNTAVTFNGSTGYVGAGATAKTDKNPNVLTLEIWFKTTTTRGGKLVCLGNARTGASAKADRHLYLTDAGRVVFGVYPGAYKTITSPTALNDGNWHLAVATLGANGQRLYIDGSPVAADPATTKGDNFSGYWRIGYDSLAGWPTQPTSSFLAGTVDEAAMYDTELTAGVIAAHYAAGRP